MHYCGAALATVLSQLLSGTACFIYMWKRYPALRLKKKDFAWDWSLAGGHIAVGLPMALQFSITAIGCIVQQTALNGLNAVAPGVVTAYAASSKIDNLANQTFQALGTASATYAGQNSGAKRFDRIRKGTLVAMVYVLAGWAIGVAFCMGLYSPLMKLFVNPEKGGDAAIYFDDIMRYGRKYLLFQSGCYLFLGTILVYRNALQGMGYSLVTMLSGVTELGARCLTAFVFVKLWGFTGACLSNPVAWISADVFLLITYFAVMHKKRVRQKREEEEAKALRKKILVVDDSATMRQGLKNLLGWDYEVSTADNGMAAIRTVTLNKPDLILLDYDMPVCNGKQALELLRSEKSSADIPVIFLTARDDADSVKGVLALGPSGYMLKTLSHAEIRARIDDFFVKNP